jgi:hypothetical protein
VRTIRTNEASFDVASQPLSSRCALDACVSPPDDACMSPPLSACFLGFSQMRPAELRFATTHASDIAADTPTALVGWSLIIHSI